MQNAYRLFATQILEPPGRQLFQELRDKLKLVPLKRAAKHSANWGLDNDGHPLLANGEDRFDLKKVSCGFRDLKPETGIFISQVYQGNTVLAVITDNPPDGSRLTLLGNAWFVPQEVRASDALRTTVCDIAQSPDTRNDT